MQYSGEVSIFNEPKAIKRTCYEVTGCQFRQVRDVCLWPFSASLFGIFSVLDFRFALVSSR
jgi:hypothetical protein